MRRIKLVLAVLAVMVATLAAFSGPAMADDLNCRDARGDLIRCDGQYYAPVNNNNDYYNNYPYYNNYYPSYYNDFYNSFYYPFYNSFYYPYYYYGY